MELGWYLSHSEVLGKDDLSQMRMIPRDTNRKTPTVVFATSIFGSHYRRNLTKHIIGRTTSHSTLLGCVVERWYYRQAILSRICWIRYTPFTHPSERKLGSPNASSSSHSESL